jgi:hypothetical protein
VPSDGTTQENLDWFESLEPTEDGPYVYEIHITKHVTNEGQTITYKNASIPKLVAAYNAFGVDYAIYADYLVKTNNEQWDYIYKNEDTGEVLINASKIKTGAL